jgi:hypothetical protein
MNILSTGSGTVRHKESERGLDLYETPAVAVETLLRVEPAILKYKPAIWEPACGRGAISEVLKAHGLLVHSSDIRPQYAGAHQFDFLRDPIPEWHPDPIVIITNPPYMLAQEFVERSFDTGVDWVFMLLRLAFLESERRSPILDDGRLVAVYPFKKRLPMMHRDGWTGNKASSAIPFAWFHWAKDAADAPTKMRRI